MRWLDPGAGAVADLSFGPDGLLAAVVRPAERGAPSVVWWDPATGAEVRRMSAYDCRDDHQHDSTDPRVRFPDGPTAFALSPDHRFAAGAWPVLMWDKWQAVVLWDVIDGQPIGVYQGPREQYADLMFFGGPFVLWGITDGGLHWEELPPVESPPAESHTLFTRGTAGATVTFDGWIAALGYPDGTVRFFDLAEQSPGSGTFVDDDTPGLPHPARPAAIRFAPDGRLIAVAAGSRVALWGYPELAARGVLACETNPTALAFIPDGSGLLVGDADGGCAVWDLAGLQSGNRLDFGLGPVTAVAVAPDGLTAAAGGANGRVVVWDLDG